MLIAHFTPPRSTRAALAALVIWAGAAGAVHAAGRLDGAWKITAPQSELKPVAGEIPFTAEGRKLYNENKRLRAKARKRLDFDAYDITKSRCSLPGVPRLMLTPWRFKIWEVQKALTFSFEWNRAIRQIDFSGVEAEPKLVPDMNGVTKAHWEGDTLVSVTTDPSERTLIDDVLPHTNSLKVTERLRLVDSDTLEDRITIEDPAYFTRPWETVLTYKRQPYTPFPEDVCLDRVEAGQPALPSR